MELTVVVAPGLEPTTLAEIRALGASAEVEESGVIALRGDEDLICRLNIHLRTATRVLVRAAPFRAASFAELERRAREVEWERVVSGETPLRLRVTCRKSRLYHSDAVAERVARSVSQRLGVQVEWSSSGEGDTRSDALSDAQLVVVRLVRDICTVSFDSSGAALHARGYRQAVAKAPLRESLAAAMILASEWAGDTPFLDPMCGSGTIPIEAALIARRIAPGTRRAFGFERWPGHRGDRLAEWRERALAAELATAPAGIHASDRDAGAVRATLGNAERAGVQHDISVAQVTIAQLDPPAGPPGWVVTNPPYGVRVGQRGPLPALYKRFGLVLRERFPGWNVALLSVDPRLERAMVLPLRELFRTRNGGIPVRCMTALIGLPDAHNAPARSGSPQAG